MKKWFFAISAGILSMFIYSLLINLIFKNPGSFMWFVGAGITVGVVKYVYEYYKEKENTEQL